MATARVGVLDELARDGGDALLGQLARNLLLVEVGVQSVGAKQELVAGQNFQVDGVDLNRLVHAERARDSILVRSVGRLRERLSRDPTVANEFVDERVILGKLHGLTAAHHVHAAVADVGNESSLADEQHRRDRRAHAALVRLLLSAFKNGQAGGLHRVLERAENIMRGDAGFVTRVGVDDVATAIYRGAEFADRHLRRNLARGVPAHPIRHDEQGKLLVDEEVVLVLLSLATDVRSSPEAQIHLLLTARPRGRLHLA